MGEWLEIALSAPYDLIEIAIIPEDRAVLHSVIAERFDQMLAGGLIAEVQALIDRMDLHENLPAIKAVGYRQVWSYLQGEIDYASMRDKAIIATRQLAKRQYTWLRSWQGLHVLAQPDLSNTLKILQANAILEIS